MEIGAVEMAGTCGAIACRSARVAGRAVILPTFRACMERYQRIALMSCSATTYRRDRFLAAPLSVKRLR